MSSSDTGGTGREDKGKQQRFADNGVLSFLRRELLIIKPHVRPLDLLLYAGVAFFLAFLTGNAYSGAVAGMLLGTLFVGYPFALDERDQIDEKYAAVGFSDRTIVTGRYLYMIDGSLLVALAAIVISLIGVSFSRVADTSPFVLLSQGSVGTMLLMAACLVLLLLIQLPIYFYFGYKRARFLSSIPLLLIFLALMAFIVLGAGDGIGAGLDILRNQITANTWILIVVLGALPVVGFISYWLSLISYRRRS